MKCVGHRDVVGCDIAGGSPCIAARNGSSQLPAFVWIYYTQSQQENFTTDLATYMYISAATEAIADNAIRTPEHYFKLSLSESLLHLWSVLEV